MAFLVSDERYDITSLDQVLRSQACVVTIRTPLEELGTFHGLSSQIESCRNSYLVSLVKAL